MRVLAQALIALAAFAGASIAAAQERLVLVEIFTAQGCSICVPADAALAELARRKNLLALGFHIDYWDYIGWPDPYAAPAFTARQRDYSARLKFPYVYTPQVVVGGTWEGQLADKHGIERAITRTARAEKSWIATRVSLLAPRRLHVSVDGAERAGEAEVLILRWDRERKTEVTRGENQGKTLLDTNVVRGLVSIATWRGEPIDLTIDLEDLGEGAGEDGYAVIVQDMAGGEILGIARVERN
jgi:hypothetical protein